MNGKIKSVCSKFTLGEQTNNRLESINGKIKSVCSKFTLGEQTNNRLESMNGKIKSVCSNVASLDTFFSELLVVLHVVRRDRTHSQPFLTTY